MYRNLLFATFAILTIACTDTQPNSNRNSSTFSLEGIDYQSLEGDKLVYEKILTPKRLMGLESVLIIAERSADTLLHAIDKESFEYRYAFGKKGLGPNEIYKVRNLHPSLNKNQLWIYGGETKKLSLFDVNSREISKEYKQKSDDVIATIFAPTYRGTFIGNQADGKNRYAEFSETGVKLKGYEQLLEIGNESREIPKSVLSYVNQGNLSANRKLDKFGLGYLYRNFIEIVDLKDSSIFTIKGPNNIEPTFDIDYSAGYPMPLFDNKKSYYCYIDTFLGDNHIYALYSGEIKERVHQSIVTTPHQLFKLNYQGELIAAYKLDISIVDLYVDEESSTVYGLSNDETPGLVTYKLK